MADSGAGGGLRLGLNADYDRIQQLANEHKILRQILGLSDWADEKYYNLQTLKDNLRLFTPENSGSTQPSNSPSGIPGTKKKSARGNRRSL